MGSFYTNITLKGPAQQRVVDHLNAMGRVAHVSPTLDGFTVVYDAASESQDQEVLSGLAQALSKTFECPALAVLNHDDDILWYQLFSGGELQDEYDSSPNYFSGPPTPPEGGDPEKLCALFGAFGSVDDMIHILGATYTFAFERHDDMARALGMPSFASGSGFNYVEAEEVVLPEGISLGMFVKTPASTSAGGPTER
ncbi:MAG: hypothetical protein AB1646_16380 [Thermodesulfobacteriota bacterium]